MVKGAEDPTVDYQAAFVTEFRIGYVYYSQPLPAILGEIRYITTMCNGFETISLLQYTFSLHGSIVL